MKSFEFSLLFLVAWAALAFGGVYPWGYYSIGLIAIGLGIWGFVATRGWHDRTVRMSVWCLLAVILATALQSIPLPLAVFERLNPGAVAVLTAVDLRYLLRPPAQHALSLQPEQTLKAAAFLAALSILFVGLVTTAARMRLDRFVTGLAGLGVCLAVLGVVQRAINAKSDDNDAWQLVYGFWKPLQAGNPFGPFINRNHFAGWMIMALPLVIAYACAILETTGPSGRLSIRRWSGWIATPEASRFMTVAVAVLVMATALVATGSRSGIAGFGVGLFVLAYFVAVRIGRRRARGLALGSLAALFLAGILWIGADRTAQRFSLVSDDIGSRVGAWHDTVRMIRDLPVFGTGIGGYGRAMLIYQTEHREVFYAQAHNDYLQIAAEGGLLVAIPVCICLTALVIGIRRRLAAGDGSVRVHWIRAGAVAGLVGIAAQAFVDFSLQIPADTLLFVVLAAIALHRPARPLVVHAHRI